MTKKKIWFKSLVTKLGISEIGKLVLTDRLDQFAGSHGNTKIELKYTMRRNLPNISSVLIPWTNSIDFHKTRLSDFCIW